MRPHTFQIPYSVVERLTPRERFVYYELCRLGAPVDTMDQTFRIQVPRGAFITSHYRMSKELDMAYSLTALLIEGLAEKGLIEWTPIEHEEFQSYYLIRVKQVLPSDEGMPSFRSIRRHL